MFVSKKKYKQQTRHSLRQQYSWFIDYSHITCLLTVISPLTMSYIGQSVQHAWRLINAENQTLGRLASAIVPMLQGKNKPTYRPNGDCGDHVVVVNAEKVSHNNDKSWVMSIDFNNLKL